MIDFLIFLACWAAFTWVVIRADQKDQEAHNRWYDHPDQIWNLHKKEKE